MKMSRTLPAMALIAGSLAVATVPAAAAPLMIGAKPTVATSNVEQVQYRGHRGGWHGGPRYGHHGYGYGHRGYGHRGYGYGAGAALGGLAAGAIIGGAIANSQAQAAQGDAVAYCSQRFKSYDPASGTYLGYDGNRHSCP